MKISKLIIIAASGLVLTSTAGFAATSTKSASNFYYCTSGTSGVKYIANVNINIQNLSSQSTASLLHKLVSSVTLRNIVKKIQPGKTITTTLKQTQIGQGTANLWYTYGFKGAKSPNCALVTQVVIKGTTFKLPTQCEVIVTATAGPAIGSTGTQTCIIKSLQYQKGKKGPGSGTFNIDYSINNS